MAITIRSVSCFITAPQGINLVVVRVDTSEPGLYGLGCATFAYRALSVKSVVEDYLDPLLRGRDVSQVGELFQLMMQNGYWRNGPIQNNAISGVDMALWDIKGKLLQAPLYQLLGGKQREAAAVYLHADGQELEDVAEVVAAHREKGVRHLRIQWQGYGSVSKVQGAAVLDEGYGVPPHGSGTPRQSNPGVYYDPRAYTRKTIQVLEFIRSRFGFEVEIIHDVHERLPGNLVVDFARELEAFHLFYLEDLVAPEEIELIDQVRQQSSTPLAMGELFNHPLEWNLLIKNRRIDFMRMHLSQMGGITPALRAAALGEACGVRTAWHGPADVSPVGHAAQIHIDVSVSNFGIQECYPFPETVRAVFPGTPVLDNGYLYPGGSPGLGVDFDEAEAAKYPYNDKLTLWTQTRLLDGSLRRP